MSAPGIYAEPVSGPVLSDDLEAVAARLVGIPYLLGGRDVPRGLDCWGLVVAIYRDAFGVPLQRWDGIDTSSPDGALTATYTITRASADWIEVENGRERPGDVVLLRRFGLPMHVAVVLGPGRMIHSDAPGGVTLARYDGATWAHRIVCFYRHPMLY